MRVTLGLEQSELSGDAIHFQFIQRVRRSACHPLILIAGPHVGEGLRLDGGFNRRRVARPLNGSFLYALGIEEDDPIIQRGDQSPFVDRAIVAGDIVERVFAPGEHLHSGYCSP